MEQAEIARLQNEAKLSSKDEKENPEVSQLAGATPNLAQLAS